MGSDRVRQVRGNTFDMKLTDPTFVLVTQEAGVDTDVRHFHSWLQSHLDQELDTSERSLGPGANQTDRYWSAYPIQNMTRPRNSGSRQNIDTYLLVILVAFYFLF